MIIRQETELDFDQIMEVNSLAFDRESEAHLVNQLREEAYPFISLVAEGEDGIYGHIAFSPCTLDTAPEINIVGLAPMSVLPDFQHSGIGSALIEAGIQRCKDHDIDAIIVLGHSDYYPKFGFRPASYYGLSCEYDVPSELFMVLELRHGALNHLSGTIQYHPAFNSL